MSIIDSLRFDANAPERITVSDPVSGHVTEPQYVFVYKGDVSRFYEWESRLSMLRKNVKDEEWPRTMNSIIEDLDGEALRVAMDIGVEELMQKTGLEKLIHAMHAHVFPHARAEAEELYQLGYQSKGILARQPGESLQSHVKRRRRWWRHMQIMYKRAQLWTPRLGMLMLLASGLSLDQRAMVLGTTSNSFEFEALATALEQAQSSKPDKDELMREHYGDVDQRRDAVDPYVLISTKTKLC